jgi:hypothetical protein
MKTPRNRCPFCESTLATVEADPIYVTLEGQRTWLALSFGCPECHGIMSIQMNPVPLKKRAGKKLRK